VRTTCAAVDRRSRSWVGFRPTHSTNCDRQEFSSVRALYVRACSIAIATLSGYYDEPRHGALAIGEK
jgi:hypothetical protein